MGSVQHETPSAMLKSKIGAVQVAQAIPSHASEAMRLRAWGAEGLGWSWGWRLKKFEHQALGFCFKIEMNVVQGAQAGPGVLGGIRGDVAGIMGCWRA